MAKHRVSSKAEIMGSLINTTVNALGLYKDSGKRILSELGLKDVRDDQWYLQQMYVDFFDAILQKTGPATMYMTGRRIAEIVNFPPEISSLHILLSKLNYFYQMDRRNCNPKEGWQYTSTSPNSATMVITSVYPDDYERGVLEGFVRKFKPADSPAIRVQYDADKPRNDTGGGSATFLINW